jgi:hypothetical protein
VRWISLALFGRFTRIEKNPIISFEEIYACHLSYDIIIQRRLVTKVLPNITGRCRCFSWYSCYFCIALMRSHNNNPKINL